MSTKRKTLLLLDSHAIIHRAFHGVPPLSTDAGLPVNAVYGYASTLLSVLEKFQPDYVIATFDLPGKTFRHDLYSDYKGTRGAPAEDLVPQFDLARELVRGFGIPLVDAENYEADDVIGALAVQATDQDVETVIVTGDRDTLQLVNDHVSVFTMSRGFRDMVIYDAAGAEQKMGVRVDQIVDFKGICGDSSDNIPGVKGIGEKGAQTLLAAYDHLEDIYAHLEDIKPALQKKLTASKEQAFLSRTLGTITCDAPVTLELAQAETGNIDFAGARQVFQKYGFTSLLKRLKDKGEKAEGGDEDIAKESVYAASAEEWQKFVSAAKDTTVVISADHDEHAIYGWGLCILGEDPIYIAHNPQALAFLTEPPCQLVAYDVKSLWHLCDRAGVVHPRVQDDLLLLAYTVRTGKKVDLAHLVFDITGEDIASADSGAQMTLDLRDHASERSRAAEHARLSAEVYAHVMTQREEIMASQPEGSSLKTLYDELELPLARVLYDMEVSGVAFDASVFEDISIATKKQLAALSEAIHDLAGETFNINSTKQLREILFEKMDLPTDGIKKTKTGYSTASSELEKLRDVHEIIAHIEKYRELFKLQTTYIDTLPGFAVADGRIHTTFHQEGTSTGRLSSSDPNLQNIPIRTESGRALRRAFVAPEGRQLISADYSQIDLRCVAHVAEDAQMIQAFQDGADIHTVTAASVMGKATDDISKEERSQAKELNFGLIYGMGAQAFSKSAGISMREAKDFIETYFQNFSGVKTYMDQTRAAAHEKGYVETLFGRRYYVSGITSANAMMRAGAERAAINMPIQGLTADIMKKAMIAVHSHIKENYGGKAELLLQIHDEVIVEADEAIAIQLATEISDLMRDVYELSVPLVVDTAIGAHWGEL